MVQAENGASHVVRARTQGVIPRAHGVQIFHLWLGPGSAKSALPHLTKQGGVGEKLPSLLGDGDDTG